MIDSVLRLGEIVPIEHKRKRETEVVPVILTPNELSRAMKRPGEEEDMLLLQTPAPNYEDIEELRKEYARVFTENQKLKARGLLARILNWEE
jgi:hypothetical protein